MTDRCTRTPKRPDPACALHFRPAGTLGSLLAHQPISEPHPFKEVKHKGGRWHLNVLKAGVDPNKYANATGVDDLDLSDFDSTDNYFECPLLPVRGNG